MYQSQCREVVLQTKNRPQATFKSEKKLTRKTPGGDTPDAGCRSDMHHLLDLLDDLELEEDELLLDDEELDGFCVCDLEASRFSTGRPTDAEP